MTLYGIGQALKTERKRQQLSLEEVYSATKIGLDILMAIEEAESDQLPHHVYARGFIRNYAQFLGLSGEEMVQAFDRAMEEDGLHGSGKEGRPGERDRAGTSRQEKPRTWRSVLLILVLLAVLVWLVYFFFLSPADKGSEQKAAPAAAENASQETGARGQAPSPEANASLAGAAPRQPAGGEGNGTEARVSEGDVEQPSPAPEEALEQNRTAGAAQGSGDNRTSRESATAEPQRHQLRIVASEACWISVEVDDGVRDFYLEPGEEQTVTFRGTGTFLLGNAGGVTLYLNGEERPVQAESGEVRELIFP